jgi:hypothetical protein
MPNAQDQRRAEYSGISENAIPVGCILIMEGRNRIEKSSLAPSCNEASIDTNEPYVLAMTGAIAVAPESDNLHVKSGNFSMYPTILSGMP